MATYAVTSVIIAGNGSPVVFALETEHSTLDELFDELADCGCVIGTRYRISKGSRGEKRLSEARQTILSTAGFISIVELLSYEDGSVKTP